MNYTARYTFGPPIVQKEGDHPGREWGGRGSGRRAGDRCDEGLWAELLGGQKEGLHA
jgi:hypothetical protein